MTDFLMFESKLIPSQKLSIWESIEDSTIILICWSSAGSTQLRTTDHARS